MTIYTRRGDEGNTDMYSGERVEKDSGRVEALGVLDELNATIGVARALDDDTRIDDQLRTVQHQLHVCQTDLATLEDAEADGGDHPRVQQRHVDWLEDAIDALDDEMPELDSFVLQTGTEQAAQLFRARAICRRAERRVVELAGAEEINPVLVKYINRLSDLLFTQARYVNEEAAVDVEAPDYSV